MDLDDARSYLHSHHRAVFATLRRNGTPQMSPVLCALDDTGAVVVSSRESAVKTKNVRRDARAWLCVFPDTFFSDRFVQVEGVASVVALPEAMDGLVAYYRTIAGDHENWDEYRGAMEREERVLIRVELTRAGPDVHG